jgi:hypothetical protein
MLSTKALTEKTSDAYSACRYNSWKACVKKLRVFGCNDNEIEAILRSKWTRWAADSSKSSYGKESSVDLINYIKKYETRASIESLTKESN